jgi:hypothetical protein
MPIKSITPVTELFIGVQLEKTVAQFTEDYLANTEMYAEHINDFLINDTNGLPTSIERHFSWYVESLSRQLWSMYKEQSTQIDHVDFQDSAQDFQQAINNYEALPQLESKIKLLEL